MNIPQVGILDFRKNIYKWIKTLPIEVIAKGETVFYVVESVDSVVTTVPKQVTTVKDGGNEIFKGKKIIEEVDGYVTEWTWEWCRANKVHDFEQGKLFKCQLSTYKDKDDNVGMLSGKKYDHVYICMDCLVYLEKQIQEGGFEYGR